MLHCVVKAYDYRVLTTYSTICLSQTYMRQKKKKKIVLARFFLLKTRKCMDCCKSDVTEIGHVLYYRVIPNSQIELLLHKSNLPNLSVTEFFVVHAI